MIWRLCFVEKYTNCFYCGQLCWDECLSPLNPKPVATDVERMRRGDWPVNISYLIPPHTAPGYHRNTRANSSVTQTSTTVLSPSSWWSCRQCPPSSWWSRRQCSGVQPAGQLQWWVWWWGQSESYTILCSVNRLPEPRAPRLAHHHQWNIFWPQEMSGKKMAIRKIVSAGARQSLLHTIRRKPLYCISLDSPLHRLSGGDILSFLGM